MNHLREAILYYSIQSMGDWSKIAKAIHNKETFKTIEYPFPYITIIDKEYPEAFKKLRYPPWILFYQGNLSLLNQESIGIVGSRQCSKQALINTKRVVNHIKAKYCVVSGLAKGVDAMAHQCALDCYTIGIIGCGIDRIYPKCNESLFAQMKEKQLIVSEYPMGVPPYAKNFPWRNRLIAAC